MPETDVPPSDLFNDIFVKARELPMHGARRRRCSGCRARLFDLLAVEEVVEIARCPPATRMRQSSGAGCCFSSFGYESSVQRHLLALHWCGFASATLTAAASRGDDSDHLALTLSRRSPCVRARIPQRSRDNSGRSLKKGGRRSVQLASCGLRCSAYCSSGSCPGLLDPGSARSVSANAGRYTIRRPT